MTPKAAIKLLDVAVLFYIQQTLEVAANMWGFGLARDDYARECYEKREKMREAMEMARKELER